MTARPSRWWRRRRRERPQDDGVMAALAAAMTTKDAVGIRLLLDPEVSMIVDGGPLEVGGELLGRDVAAIELLSYPSELTVSNINGAPGIVARRDGRVVATISARVSGGRIVTLWSMRNPEKLRRWDAPS